MEIFELKYFLSVAELQNISKASGKINVSPSALSKAIARLEAELNTKLFKRDGKGLVLTEQGLFLQKEASRLIHIEEAVKSEFSSYSGTLNVKIAGEEALLLKFGKNLSKEIKSKYSNASFQFISTQGDQTLKAVQKGEAHIGLTTENVPGDLYSKKLTQVVFQTCVGKNHPFYEEAEKKTFSVQEVLEKSFVSPSTKFMGKISNKISADGWRDDIFPRKIEYIATSLKVLENILLEEEVIAYIPDHYAKELNVRVLKLSGCPYSCEQNIHMVVKNPKEISWLNQIF